jgi:hypothetical protein
MFIVGLILMIIGCVFIGASSSIEEGKNKIVEIVVKNY